MDQKLLLTLAPVGGVLAFAAIWLLVCALMSLLSGWRGLAREFRSHEATTPREFGWASGRMGGALPVNLRNVLTVGVDARALELSVMVLFRAFQPKLRIPWDKVKSVETGKQFWMDYARVELRDHWPRITVYGEAGRAIAAAFADAKRR